MAKRADGNDRRREPVVQVRGLRLGYGSRVVLNHLDLCVRVGEFWFLLGPNGTGKTTLLKALLGMVRPQAGEILAHSTLAGRDRVGFVPQSCGLNPTLPTTVREFVLLGLVGIRANHREDSERLAWALNKVGLEGMAKRDYWSLSGGQRQRVLVARALARRPALLIMDEPTNGLDLAAETALLDYVARLNREEGLTVLFVSHNLVTAARYGTHVAVFHERGVETGPAAEVLKVEKLERVYGMDLEGPWQGSVATGERRIERVR